uniref:Uncharacterized protein n=1 Tax=Solanum lycopersicum TaxID=4081 RepID=K4AUQ9_SOLLC
MMQKVSWSILDQIFLYEKYESMFEEGEGDGSLDSSFRGKRIIYDEEVEHQENDSGFLQSGTMQYKIRDRSQGFFQINQLIWDPVDPLFFLLKDQPPCSVFSLRELFADEEILKGLLTSQTDHLISLYKR